MSASQKNNADGVGRAAAGAAAGGAGAATGAAVFPVGPAGKRELRRALRRAGAGVNPATIVANFQQTHSLHTMMSRALGTTPLYESTNGGESTTAVVESLDTDSVMQFLSNLGVRQYEVHKRISDTLLKKLEDEIRKTSAEQPLLDLLQDSWVYAVSLPELRPILQTVLRQLGERTPPQVLQALAERQTPDDPASAAGDNANNTMELKHHDIFDPLPWLLKKLVWESDWQSLFGSADTSTDGAASSSNKKDSSNNKGSNSTADDALTPEQFEAKAEKTLVYQTMMPLVEQYCQNKLLIDSANRPFVGTLRERRLHTTQRRALTSSTMGLHSSANATTGTSALTSASLSTGTTSQLVNASTNSATGVVAGLSGLASSNKANTATNASTSAEQQLDSGKAIAQLRVYLSDSPSSAGSSSSRAVSKLAYRPKLLYAFMSILIAQHGRRVQAPPAPTPDNQKDPPSSTNSTYSVNSLLGGADHLSCTLLADILLSAGGPLPKAYQHVLSLARHLDECVQEGNVSDAALLKIQAALRDVFAPDQDSPNATSKKGGGSAADAQGGGSAGNKGKDDGKNISSKDDKENKGMTNAEQRQLNLIITAGITALKEADPQSLFLNPVTDKVAPRYSKIIKKPMCISMMEGKIERNEYSKVEEWEKDVKLMFKNCVDYNGGESGQWFRNEAFRQGKVFREEILPQAKKLIQAEVTKKQQQQQADDLLLDQRKRKVENKPTGPAIAPLESATKRRKKDKEDLATPSMPALAFMLLADPFVVRILLARVLREVRVSVTGGSTLPAAHAALPSLLQLLHMARWSRQICAIRAKRYLVPTSGMTRDEIPGKEADAAFQAPYATLREDLPLLVRLQLEADLDKRVVPGGDWHDAAQSDESLKPEPINPAHWVTGMYLEVPIALVEGAMVHLCLPGSSTDTALGVSFKKFAAALKHLAATSTTARVLDDTIFFQCLIRAIVRHKAKLSKPARDAIAESWLSWLVPEEDEERRDEGSMTLAAHECYVMLLNEWAAIGNQILPRDTLLEWVKKGVEAAESSESSESRKLATMWELAEPNKFSAVKKQYERMLSHLPTAIADQWKQEMGITPPVESMEE